MKESVRGWCRLPMSEKALRGEVDRYFEKCAQEDVPPTPSGLALALGVRTSMLTDERLSPEQRRVIGQAMQRMEAGMMEMMILRGGVKGIENVLERVEESEDSSGGGSQIGRMTDGEIEERLKKVSERIGELLGGEESCRSHAEKKGEICGSGSRRTLSRGGEQAQTE